MSAIICGGPKPVRNCYGGCYEWCITPSWCGPAPDELTDKDRRAIVRFQARCGGFYVNDLREAKHWDLSERMASALLDASYLDALQTDRTAQALSRRGLVEWWESLGPEHFRDHWHLLGEGGCAATALRRERDVPEPEWTPCPCVGGPR